MELELELQLEMRWRWNCCGDLGRKGKTFRQSVTRSKVRGGFFFEGQLGLSKPHPPPKSRTGDKSWTQLIPVV